jgi:hypothetical protein
MQIPKMFPRFLVAVVLVSFFASLEASAQSQQAAPKYEPVGLNVPPPPGPDLFEVSLGFNYLYLSDQFPETKNLYGVEASAFINATSWLAAGGEFMADFGSHSINVFFNRTFDIDSQRYIYVFGPRVTIWQNPKFKVFLEGLGGGVHAEAKLTSTQFTFLNRTASADGFATVLGAGFDWRLSNHLSWRVVQADYVGTDLSSHWQNDFRASTSIAYSFGRR